MSLIGSPWTALHGAELQPTLQPFRGLARSQLATVRPVPRPRPVLVGWEFGGGYACAVCHRWEEHGVHDGFEGVAGNGLEGHREFVAVRVEWQACDGGGGEA